MPRATIARSSRAGKPEYARSRFIKSRRGTPLGGVRSGCCVEMLRVCVGYFNEPAGTTSNHEAVVEKHSVGTFREELSSRANKVDTVGGNLVGIYFLQQAASLCVHTTADPRYRVPTPIVCSPLLPSSLKYFYFAPKLKIARSFAEHTHLQPTDAKNTNTLVSNHESPRAQSIVAGTWTELHHLYGPLALSGLPPNLLSHTRVNYSRVYLQVFNAFSSRKILYFLYERGNNQQPAPTH